MFKFWFLLTLAFVDVALALVLGSRGYASESYLFLLAGGILGAYAFSSAPSTHRDARGRLQRTELPYGSVLGTVGALVILSSAAYVAVISTRPATKTPRPVRVEVAARPAPTGPTYVPPRSYRPTATTAALFKCVDPAGHATYQSLPCPADSEQAWVRDATPEPEPTPAQRRQLARQREARARSSTMSYPPGYSPVASSSSTRAEGSAACQAARAADAAYRRQPLRHVTHDGLRWHGDQIRASCG